jgi:hypothetical protein
VLVNKDNQTDEQLMKLYQNGDEEAFKVLYGRPSSKIYGFLKKRQKFIKKFLSRFISPSIFIMIACLRLLGFSQFLVR